MGRPERESPRAQNSRLRSMIATRGRPLKKPGRKPKSRRLAFKWVESCPSKSSYTCQVNLLIILNARSYQTFRLLRHSDSKRTIELEHPFADYSAFADVLYDIREMEPLPLKPRELDALQESLLAALRLLHAKNISFPVSVHQLEIIQPSKRRPNGVTSPTLFFRYNEKASWASDEWSPAWKDKQLSDAKAIFRPIKILLRLRDPSSRPSRLDLKCQETLAKYLTGRPILHHVKMCMGIDPMTAELTYRIALALVLRSSNYECLEVLESFFGGPIPLPKPDESPDAIYASLRDLRARACESKGYGSMGLTQDLSDQMQLGSPELATRLVCCMAEVVTSAGLKVPEWWLVAMKLYDAFLPNSETTRLERVCKEDRYHIRNKVTS